MGSTPVNRRRTRREGRAVGSCPSPPHVPSPRARPRPLRPEPHRPPPHRRPENGPLQLPPRAPAGGRLRPPHRGHRPGPLRRRRRGRHHREPPVGRARLRRGPRPRRPARALPPEPPHRPLPRGRGGARRLRSAGLAYAEGPGLGGPHAPYHQTRRTDRYRAALEALVAAGHAYYASATPEALEAMRQRLATPENPAPKYDAATRMQMENSL